MELENKESPETVRDAEGVEWEFSTKDQAWHPKEPESGN